MHPHYALNAIVRAGLRGIEEKMDIRIPPEASRAKGDAAERLPRTLHDALERFRDKDSVARRVFGDEFVDHFSISRSHELKQWGEAVTDWEFNRYVETTLDSRLQSVFVFAPIPRSRERAPEHRIRPRRPPIFRVKTGCFTCRSRKKKCDELRPVCTGCERNKLGCRWPTSRHTKTVRPCGAAAEPEISLSCDEDTASTTNKNRALLRDASPCQDVSPCQDAISSYRDGVSSEDQDSPARHSSSPTLSTILVDHAPIQPSLDLDLNLDQEVSLSSGPQQDYPQDSPSSIEPDSEHLDSHDGFTVGFLRTDPLDDSLHLTASPPPSTSQIEPVTLTNNVSLLPAHDKRSLQLLGHYLFRTALSMGNGSTFVNPFISQLIPLTFANNLILDLILCQAAVQCVVEDPSQVVVANRRYYNSIKQFRQAVDQFIRGKQQDPLWLALGALTMCFTESAKGDTKGVFFNHISGVAPLVAQVLNGPLCVGEGLKDFVTEYYLYAASIIILSSGGRY
ncbi:hypothetical protein QQX98_000395 [Neonectria punicea]|uniref:Zn(2)-C6 fungal-type domain-containing protein n=1 Tax=Neonectria punicea TaxID=979145 RepID=A0ABR1HU66_9HYPO